MSGSLPVDLGNIPNLARIDLSSNLFAGTSAYLSRKSLYNLASDYFSVKISILCCSWVTSFRDFWFVSVVKQFYFYFYSIIIIYFFLRLLNEFIIHFFIAFICETVFVFFNCFKICWQARFQPNGSMLSLSQIQMLGLVLLTALAVTKTITR